MIKQVLIILVVIIITGCAGKQVVHTPSDYQIDKSGKYIVFPFRNPTFKEKEFPGVGARFTNKFVAACTEYGLNVMPIFNE